MLLDNVFPMLGGMGTAAAMMGILTLVGVPALGQFFCPLKRMAPRGR